MAFLPTVLVLGLAAVAAFLLSARGSPPELAAERALAARALAVATGIQAIHFAEEAATGFHERLGDLFGLPDMPFSFFVAFNLAWLGVWVISVPGLLAGRRFAFFAAWFLAIAGVVNGIAHPLLALASGGYFPGVWSAPFIAAACVWLWIRLRVATGGRRTSMPEPAALVVLVAVLGLGCDSTAETGGGPDEWSVEASPVVSIGELEGDSVYLFDEVRAAHFASDGRIVVADAGMAVLRVFDAGGDFLVQMGREGDGPGEFRYLRKSWMVSPDTVGVWDSQATRLTYFSVDGEFVGNRSLRAGEATPPENFDVLVGGLSDGSVVLGWVALGPVEQGLPAPDVIGLERFGSDGSYLGQVGRVPGLVRAPGTPVPFSPFPYFAVRGDSVYFTDGLNPRVEVRGPEGGGARVIRFPGREVDEGEAWQALEVELELRNHWQLPRLAEMSRSDPIPHLAGLLLDDEGRVWTKQYDPGQDALWLDGGARIRGGTWWVAAPSGELVAAVTLPPRLIPFEVRSGMVLGLEVDDLGVERVVVYALPPSSAPR